MGSRKTYSLEEKVNVILLGLKNESSIKNICDKFGISLRTYYMWKDTFLEGGKQALIENKKNNNDELNKLVIENERLKKLVANLSLENMLLKNGDNNK